MPAPRDSSGPVLADPDREAGLRMVYATLAAAYGERARRVGVEFGAWLRVMDLVLAPWPLAAIQSAVVAHVARAVHPPTPAELRGILEHWTLRLPDADEAVGEIIRAVREKRLGDLAPVLAGIAREYAGPIRDVSCDGGVPLRAQLREAYKAAAARLVEVERGDGGRVGIPGLPAPSRRAALPAAGR